MQALSEHLLHSVAGARCGVVLPAHVLPPEPCDDTGPLFEGRRVHNAATQADPANPWQTVSGAVALDARGAANGAIAEALERGWLSQDAERVWPTEMGRRFTNDVLELFLDVPVEADIGA